MRIKQVGNHVPQCYAIRAYEDGTWNTPWAYITDESVNLDKLGRRTRGIGERWVKVICNCTFCDAVLLIAENDILKLATRKPTKYSHNKTNTETLIKSAAKTK